MKKWLIPLIILSLALTTGGVATAVTLNSDSDGDPTPYRSDEDIDPNKCNWVHNITACDEDIGADERYPVDPFPMPDLGGPGEPSGFEVEGEPEPIFSDGEPGYIVQSPREAIEMDCGLAGGTVYLTSEGEVGCAVVHDLEDNGNDLISPSQLPVIEPYPVAAPQ